MVLVVPREREETRGVKIGELPSWILTGDNPQKEFLEHSRGHCHCYKYVNVIKGSSAGISIVLAAHMLLNYCRSHKELK